jgi:hypothetical protein
MTVEIKHVMYKHTFIYSVIFHSDADNSHSPSIELIAFQYCNAKFSISNVKLHCVVLHCMTWFSMSASTLPSMLTKLGGSLWWSG